MSTTFIKKFVVVFAIASVVAFAIGGVTPAGALATPTIFVNPDGDCGGNTPCYTTIQAAIDYAVNFDVIEVQTSADYPENLYISTTGSLAGAASPIPLSNLTIQNKPGDTPTVIGGCAPNTQPSSTSMVRLDTAPYFTWDGIDIVIQPNRDTSACPTGTIWRGVPGDGIGTRFGGVFDNNHHSDHLTFKNFDMLSGVDGIDLDSSTDDVLVENVTFLNFDDPSISFYAATGQAIELKNPNVGGGSTGYRDVIVRNSQFLGYKQSLQINNNQSAPINNDHIILVEDCLMDGMEGAPHATALPHIEVMFSADVVFRNNIVARSAQQGIVLLQGSNVTLDHNTFYQNGLEQIFVDTTSTLTLIDNIIDAGGKAALNAATPANVTESYTLLWNSAGGFTGWEAGSLLVGDPLFFDPGSPTNDFRLNCSSPGIGTSSTVDNRGAVQALTSSDCLPSDEDGPLTTNVVANPNPVAINTAIQLTANVDDSDTGGSNIASAEYSLDGGAWTAMSASDSTFDEVSEDVTANFTTPSTPGIYDLCVRGTDEHGNVGEPECIMFVVYDPSGGFVTGGGWIMSPLGAYAADPTLTGKANFGFVAKYKKGANVPDGNTEFQFKAGDLNFKSTSYQWLVVAGNKAQFKGEGTINGQGSYKFMIFADDDSPDTFRIQISDDGVTVYDNGPNQALGGGSIVVHK